MGYEYHPKFPRAKLHEVVTHYIASLRQLRREPNCRVAFRERETVRETSVRGWLLRDPRPESGMNRYLLLEDGDVWRESEASGAAPGASDRGEFEWLEGPDDDIVTLLAQSLGNARMAGNGFLEDEEDVELHPHVVDDRRRGQQPHQGPERRKTD
jgi:hypothetical protein